MLQNSTAKEAAQRTPDETKITSRARESMYSRPFSITWADQSLVRMGRGCAGAAGAASPGRDDEDEDEIMVNDYVFV